MLLLSVERSGVTRTEEIRDRKRERKRRKIRKKNDLKVGRSKPDHLLPSHHSRPKYTVGIYYIYIVYTLGAETGHYTHLLDLI
jgi:hypothetical protein